LPAFANARLSLKAGKRVESKRVESKAGEWIEDSVDPDKRGDRVERVSRES
jgi:hypothetical protein